MNDKVMYICNPEKNKACEKSACLANPYNKYGSCYCTTHEEYAMRDINGNPIYAADWIEHWIINRTENEKDKKKIKEMTKGRVALRIKK